MPDETRHVTSTPAEDPRAPVTGHPEPAPPDLEIDEDGWLSGINVHVVPSVRHSPLDPRLDGPIAIVWHTTAVKPGVPLWDRIRKYRRGVDRPASWHLLIEEDGIIHQSVPFERGAWHCATGTIDGFRPNRCSVGIEMAAGPDYATKVWPELQLRSAERVVAALVGRYSGGRYAFNKTNAKRLHRLLDPTRRADPGASFEVHLPGIVDRAFASLDPRVA